MQAHVVVAKLDVSDLQVHVEMDVGVLRQFVEQIECGAFDRFQRDACLGTGRVDLIADEAHAHQPVAGAEYREGDAA